MAKIVVEQQLAMASTSRALHQLALLLLLLEVALSTVDAAKITVVNKCPYTVWPGALPGGGARVDQGATWEFDVPAGTAHARIWARTGCNFDDAGRGSCETGDCGGALVCALSGQPPTTLAEYTLGPQAGNPNDFLDLSLIDGFNVPMSMQPADGAGCRGPSCAADVTAQCPSELKVAGGCLSACNKFGNGPNGDTYCCRGQYEVNCPPTNYSQFFKGLCPDAYSYAKDDQTSTFTCPPGTNYNIVLCP